MKRVLTAVVLIPLVLLVLFKAPLWLFTLVVGAVALVATHEYLGLLEHYGLVPLKALTLLLSVTVFCLTTFAFWSDNRSDSSVLSLLVLALIVTSPIVFLIASMRHESLAQALPSAASSALAIPYLTCTLLSLVFVREVGGIFMILYLFSVVWSGDIFAYYVGRSIGKHKLAPRISPGKSWEGTIASLAGSLLVGMLVFYFNPEIIRGLIHVGLWHESGGWHSLSYYPIAIAVLSICINIAAQVGDLLESMIKRGAGVKDSGSLLPGHGGILDRIDALLLATPIALIYAIMNQQS